jgi:lysophospholipase L1-like esterase
MPISSLTLACEELERRELPAAPFDTLPVVPSDLGAVDHARAVAARGEALGRRVDVFMKVGDSNTELVPFTENGYLKPLGAPDYDPLSSGLAALGQNLVKTLNVFRAPIAGDINSLTRISAAAHPGFRASSVLPFLASEVAATNAGVALIMLGTNDVVIGTTPQQFTADLGQIVNTLDVLGVVPILSTIPEMTFRGGQFTEAVRVFNQIIADFAGQNHVPLWNLFRQEEALPFSGLDPGGLHLSQSPNGGGSFAPPDLQFGQNLHNLGALQVLDWYRHEVVGGEPEAMPMVPTWTAPKAGEPVYAVGRGPGQQPVVSLHETATGEELNRFLAYDPAFAGGVRVAVADVNGDGVADIVTGPGIGGGPLVKIFDGATGSLIGQVMAFEPAFRGGVNVAAADLDGDGQAEVVVGAGLGGGPVVAIFHGGDLAEVARFAAYEPTFRGGVTVAAANLDGFGPAVATGSGEGGGPVVKVFRYGDAAPAMTFFAYDPTVRSGVVVATGNINGASVIATAPGFTSSHVRLFDPATSLERVSFFAASPAELGGVRLAVSGGKVLVANGPGSPVLVRAFTRPGLPMQTLLPDDPTRAFGLAIG